MSDKYSLAEVILNQDPEMDGDKRFNRMTNIAECWVQFNIEKFRQRKQKNGGIFYVIDEFWTKESFETMLGIKQIKSEFVTECMEWFGFRLVKTFENESINYYWIMDKDKFIKDISRKRIDSIEIMEFVRE